MRKERCETCRHWDLPDPEEGLGHCRISPASLAGWPMTGPQDWCSRGYQPTEALENQHKRLLADLVAGEG
jgi:hypothetical protein